MMPLKLRNKALVPALFTMLCYWCEGAVAEPVERVRLSSPEGWGMSHTLSAALNLGSPLLRPPESGQLGFSAELGSIPHLSREEQRIGFGGFKAEDLNKSPVFGRARLLLGLPADMQLELSWTPPLEIDGGRPEGIFGLAVTGSLYRDSDWALDWRLFALRGEASGDITCSREVAAAEPGTVDNPFGCREPSSDRIALDHEGVELLGSRSYNNGRWQPFIGVAYTRVHPHVRVRARVFEVLDRSELDARGQLRSLTVGTAFRPLPNWSWHLALSYTPLEVKRPPSLSARSQDFWSVRLGLQWQPHWHLF